MKQFLVIVQILQVRAEIRLSATAPKRSKTENFRTRIEFYLGLSQKDAWNLQPAHCASTRLCTPEHRQTESSTTIQFFIPPTPPPAPFHNGLFHFNAVYKAFWTMLLLNAIQPLNIVNTMQVQWVLICRYGTHRFHCCTWRCSEV